MKRVRIDWGAVKDRLRANERALEEGLTPNPQRLRDAYRQRAVRLAVAEVHRVPKSPGFPALVFRLDQERYAIEMKELAEVLRFAHCVPVPGGSAQFLGVISLRGQLRAVLDLRSLLAASVSKSDTTGLVLMLRRAGQEIGMKVDDIEELREIRPEELMPSSQGRYSRGLVSGTLAVLDVGAVLEAAFSKEELRTA